MDFKTTNKFIISLPRRSDRKELLQSQLPLLGQYEWLEAVDGNQLPYNPRQPLPTGESHLTKTRIERERIAMSQAACRMSHQAGIQIAKDNNWPYVILIEDDADFDVLIADKVDLWIKEVPDDWEQLYFGAHNFRQLEMISEHVGKCVTTLSTIAYAVKQCAYDKILKELATPGILDILFCNNLHTKLGLKAYCFKPNLVVQRKGMSDIEGEFMDYQHYYRK